MKVKIAYTVDLEEVELEVQELITRALNNLEVAHSTTEYVCDKLDTQQVSIENLIRKIEQAREEMLKADTVLNDCQTILEGYDNILKKAEESEDA
jgi:myo-inositol-1-phosphate synthase